MPPHTLITCPETYEPISEAKNKQQFATSSGFPALFNGIFCIQVFTTSSPSAPVISVSIKPGAMALHRMFLEPNSCAIDLVKPIMPDLDAE